MICGKCNETGVKNIANNNEFWYCKTCKEEIRLDVLHTPSDETKEIYLDDFGSTSDDTEPNGNISCPMPDPADWDDVYSKTLYLQSTNEPLVTPPIGSSCVVNGVAHKTTSKGYLFKKVTPYEWLDVSTGLVWSETLRENINHYEAAEVYGDRLPTRAQFEQAEKHGIREVMDDFESKYFWSSSLLGAYYAYLFYGTNGYIAYYNRYYAGGSVRCVRKLEVEGKAPNILSEDNKLPDLGYDLKIVGLESWPPLQYHDNEENHLFGLDRNTPVQLDHIYIPEDSFNELVELSKDDAIKTLREALKAYVHGRRDAGQVCLAALDKTGEFETDDEE